MHPNNDLNTWNCEECNGKSYGTSLAGLWSENVYIFLPLASIGNNINIENLWLAINYPTSENSEEWTTADYVN